MSEQSNWSWRYLYVKWIFDCPLSVTTELGDFDFTSGNSLLQHLEPL